MSLSRRPDLISPSLAHYGRIAAAAAAVALAGAAPGCGNGAGPPSSGGQAQAPSHTYVTLARGIHPFARPELDRGPLDPEKVIANLSVVFSLTPAQTADRDALIAAQLDPASPSYHQWLTPETYAARFGASADTVARTRSWLSQQGLQVHEDARLGSRVTFSGRVADLQTAFRAPMRRFEVSGHMHYAMAGAPSVPSDLADAILGIRNTHDFFPHSMLRMGEITAPAYQAAGTQGFAPADWAKVYDVTPLYTVGVSGTPINGAGVTIGIVGVAQIGQGDIDQFRTKFGLPPTTVTMTLVPNTGPAEPGLQSAYPGAGLEAFLDTEWSGGIATGATVNYVFTGRDDGNVDDATYYAIENNLTPILSESFGGCEYGLTPSDADIVSVYGSAAELLGITYVASSGDSGADGCGGSASTSSVQSAGLYVDVPAAYPGVTSVGGSEFPKNSITYDVNSAATGYSTKEQCWNDGNNPATGIGAGGGGISNVWARPSYQSAIPTCTILGSLPTTVTPSSMRQVPDIAVNAASANNPDFIMCTVGTSGPNQDCLVNGAADSVIPVGGTSAAAPAFAGVVALLEQAVGGRLGNINPLLYSLSASTPGAFHDITLGANDIVCTPGQDPGCAASGHYGYLAAPGYDCATGLGSVDVANLVRGWAALAPTTTSLVVAPTATTAGGAVTLTATVDVTAPNASALGGNVRFNFQSYSPDGTPDLAWTLGSTAIAGGTVSAGTAAFGPGPIPAGLVDPGAQYVDVVAMYGGDGSHLASTSAKMRLAFSSVSFCVVPAYGGLLPGQTVQFSETGGTPPVRWYTSADTTCDMNGNCSTMNETTGAFKAGPQNGYVVIVGIDANGVEQVSNLVVGTPTTGRPPPWGDAQAPLGGCTAVLDGGTPPVPEGGAPVDAGAFDAAVPFDAAVLVEGGAAVDSGPMVTPDAAEDDAAVLAEAGSAGTPVKSGCGCKVAGGRERGPMGAMASLALGLAVAVRRRRRR